jgi:hypothetical protein
MVPPLSANKDDFCGFVVVQRQVVCSSPRLNIHKLDRLPVNIAHQDE